MGLMDKIEQPEDGAPEAAGPATVATPPVTAVAVRPVTAVAVASTVAETDFIASVKNAMPVEYNTLAQIKCTNGNFLERETNTPLGDTVVFELLSWQDAYVAAPNDDKAPKEMVKFSDDGIYDRDGQPLAEYVADLKAQGYSKAGIKHRVVVVGAIVQCSKTDKFSGQPVQFDFSPETRTLFQRYQALCSYGQRTGKLTAKQVQTIKGVCRLVTKSSNTYTVVDFTPAG